MTDRVVTVLDPVTVVVAAPATVIVRDSNFQAAIDRLNAGLAAEAAKVRVTSLTDTPPALTAMGVEAAEAGGAPGSVAIGYHALFSSPTTGGSCTAIGPLALNSNTDGENNVAIGGNALGANTELDNGTAVGSGALSSFNATLADQPGGDSKNTAVGSGALQGLTTGIENTAVGDAAGWPPFGRPEQDYATTTASRCTFVGQGCGQISADQSDNAVAIGFEAQIDGDGAIAIGTDVVASAAGAVAIGRDSTGTPATTTTQDQFVLGTPAHHVVVPGDLETPGGVILASPDGTRWRLVVSNAGVLSTVAA